MSEAKPTVPPGSTRVPPMARQHWHGFGAWLIEILPFLLLGVASVVGMAWNTVTGEPNRLYWMMYTPFAALVCIYEGWRICTTGPERMRLIIAQAMQWAATGVAMYVLMLTGVRGLMNDDAVGLTLLMLVALGIFTSGVHERVWRLCVLGIFMGIAVPTIAWVESAVLLMAGVLLVVCVVLFLVWWLRKRPTAAGRLS